MKFSSKSAPREAEGEVGQSELSGTSKSGRFWKTSCNTPFSKIKKDKGFSTKWQKKLDLKQQKHVVKAISQDIRDEKTQSRLLKKQRHEENQRRRVENERKAEIVQVIKNTRKLKKLRKKQVRTIEKRDVS